MTPAPSLTLGIEEEFQLIDPESRGLKSHIMQILEDGKTIIAERVKPEIHQSVAEVGTGICKTIEDADKEVRDLRRMLRDLAKNKGLRIAAAGTHPFSDWRDQLITPNARYDTLIEEMQLVARANLIFGLHVHIGIEDRDLQIAVLDADMHVETKDQIRTSYELHFLDKCVISCIRRNELIAPVGKWM